MADLILSVFKAVWNGMSRVLHAWRNSPGESHNSTEYADAFLFPPEDANDRDDQS